jgi:hypothetical protein
LSWKHWFERRETIYSNYHLYKIPYIYVDGFDKFDKMKNGFVAMDELWLVADARTSRATKNRITSNILAKSRKRGLTIAFTAQVLNSIDNRIRQIVDFLSYPIMNPNETLVKLLIFRGSKASNGNYLKTLYYKTPLVYEMYDTCEEVEMKEESDTPMQYCFQVDQQSPPQFFKTWEEADKVAEKWWVDNQKILKTMI